MTIANLDGMSPTRMNDSPFAIWIVREIAHIALICRSGMAARTFSVSVKNSRASIVRILLPRGWERKDLILEYGRVHLSIHHSNDALSAPKYRKLKGFI